MTIVEWIDVFSRNIYRDIIIDSLKYCISEKGLNVYAYCIMTNHIHLVVNCNEPFQLKDTIRDFKKFTSKALIKEVSRSGESRREWLLERFRKAANQSAKSKNYKVWQTGNHAIELYNQRFTWVKVNYIHQNPVRAGFVDKAEDWKYSSVSNYLGREQNVLQEVICISPPINFL